MTLRVLNLTASSRSSRFIRMTNVLSGTLNVSINLSRLSSDGGLLFTPSTLCPRSTFAAPAGLLLS